MVNQEHRLLQRVRGIMPDLTIEHVELNQDGLINDVVIVNRTLVFRFTKQPGFNKYLGIERQVLNLLQDRVRIAVPSPIYHGSDFVVYRYLDGQPLLRENIISLDKSTQSYIAEQLGHFLYTLHKTPVDKLNPQIPQTTAPVTRDIWLDKYIKIKEKVYPLLLPHQIQWAENLFNNAFNQPDFFAYDHALIHGDLAPYHILFDNQTNALSGVIDFGVAGIGNAALDFGSLISSYGESFVGKMKASYPNLDILLPRARFSALAIEFEWVLNGLVSGETFWFTAHIGGARDIGT